MNEDIQLLVHELKANNKISEWEKQFIYNIDKIILRGESLSYKQVACIKKIGKENAKDKPLTSNPFKEKLQNLPAQQTFGCQPKGSIIYSGGDKLPWEE